MTPALARRPAAVSPPLPRADPAFFQSLYRIHRRHWAIADRYAMLDAAGRTLMVAERPAHLLRYWAALGVGLAAGTAAGYGAASQLIPLVTPAAKWPSVAACVLFGFVW